MWLHLRQLALVAFVAGAPGLAVAADDWQAQVGEALGKTGATTPGGIYRVGMPRTDLKVTLDGVELKAGFQFDAVQSDLEVGSREAHAVDATWRRRAGLSKSLADLRLPVIGSNGKNRRSS